MPRHASIIPRLLGKLFHLGHASPAARHASTEPRRLRLEPLAARRLLAGDAAALATEFAYELNRIRVSPTSFVAEAPDEWQNLAPRHPLASNATLRAAAADHALQMATTDFFAHRAPDDDGSGTLGPNANQRLRQAGYPLPPTLADDENHVELIAAGSTLDDAFSALRELLNDGSRPSRDRRQALLGIDEVFAEHHEIGVGFAAAPDSQWENYWTIELAHRAVSDRFVTGVVYDDLNANGRFDAGEGREGILVRSGALATTSDATGAYTLRLGVGIHEISMRESLDEPATSAWVRVETGNVQVDFPNGDTAQVNFRDRSLWTNPLRHLDVNQTEQIEPLDALVIINHLNRFGAGPLTLDSTTSETPWIDTNGDATASPLDALLVINYLNRATTAEGESSSAVLGSSSTADAVTTDVIAIAAGWTEWMRIEEQSSRTAF